MKLPSVIPQYDNVIHTVQILHVRMDMNKI